MTGLTMVYGVALVIGTAFNGLEELAERMHVWAPETAENDAIAKRTKAAESENWNECGVTLYYYEPGETAEETFLSLVDTIDLHHGPFSHDPPWSFLQVHGLKPTEAVCEALKEHEIDKIEETADGFIASRSRYNPQAFEHN